eukprot:1906437-Amphidinium_carterae.1
MLASACNFGFALFHSASAPPSWRMCKWSPVLLGCTTIPKDVLPLLGRQTSKVLGKAEQHDGESVPVWVVASDAGPAQRGNATNPA